jgi:hypothetical protein
MRSSTIASWRLPLANEASSMLGLTSLVFFFALDLLEDEMSGVHPLQLLIRGLSWRVFVG